MTDEEINAAVGHVAGEFASVVDNDADATLVMVGLMAHFCACFGACPAGQAKAVQRLRADPDNSAAALEARKGRLQ